MMISNRKKLFVFNGLSNNTLALQGLKSKIHKGERELCEHFQIHYFIIAKTYSAKTNASAKGNAKIEKNTRFFARLADFAWEIDEFRIEFQACLCAVCCKFSLAFPYVRVDVF